jgi:phage tail-like protein
LNTKKSMGEVLYDLLPQLYKTEDSRLEPNPYQLKRFLQINGVGLDYLRDKAKGHSDLFSVDNTPPELLPHLAEMLGFEFPYSMSVNEQRSLIKLLPTLYKLKGTQSVFDYLSRQIFGLDAKAYSDWVSRGGENGENLIRINIEANGETPNLQPRIDRYYAYSEKFRPVNHKLFWSIVLHYTEDYERQSKLHIDYRPDIIFMDDDYNPNEDFLLNTLVLNDTKYRFPRLQGDWYDKNSKLLVDYDLEKLLTTSTDRYTFSEREGILLDTFLTSNEDIYHENKIILESFLETILIDDSYPIGHSTLSNDFILNKSLLPPLDGEVYERDRIEVFTTDLLLEVNEEVYNKEVLKEDIFSTNIKYTEEDTYLKLIGEEISDKGMDLTNCLNTGNLNSTMKLVNELPTITTY